MGKTNLTDASHFIENLTHIYCSIITPIHLVSQTVTFQLASCMVPVNLYKIARYCNEDRNVLFEPELFPAINLLHWKPLHVNLFANGKVIILGRNALDYVETIDDWIFLTYFCLPEEDDVKF